MNKAFDGVNLNKRIGYYQTFQKLSLSSWPTTLKDNKDTLKIQFNQHLEYHKVEFGLQHYLKFTSLRLPSLQQTYKSRHKPMTYYSISHQSLFEAQLLIQQYLYKVIHFFTPDPAEYGTTNNY